MKNWTNLHNHTVFSMLDGHGRIEQYLDRAKSLGMKGIATTDHGNIHSWLDFYDAGIASGVKPILGSEMYQARKSRFDRDEEERSGPSKNEWEQRGPYHITILAKNNVGYKNIIKILENTTIFCLPSYREGMPKSVLEASAAGIPCVVSDSPGCKESIKHNVTGLTFKNKNYINNIIKNRVNFLNDEILKVVPINNSFPAYINKNIRKFSNWIVK